MTNHLRIRRSKRGFTLVELMIVVAIIGILAALAIYGLEQYVANSKTAEAKQHVGSLSRAAYGAYEGTLSSSEDVLEGDNSATEDHVLCDDAIPVPLTPPPGNKYQPRTTSPNDFNGGDKTNGWMCLRFNITSPIHYRYTYTRGGPVNAPGNPTECGVGDNCFEAAAQGDLNGDGVAHSHIARTGHVNPVTKRLKGANLLYVLEEDE